MKDLGNSVAYTFVLFLSGYCSLAGKLLALPSPTTQEKWLGNVIKVCLDQWVYKSLLRPVGIFLEELWRHLTMK